MERQEAVDEFVAKYLKSAVDPSSGPNPTLEELVKAEEELADVATTMDLLELTDEQREKLRGLRVADLPDLMAETAEGLRLCPDVADDIGTDPEVLERVSELDMAVASLTVAFSILHNCTDTGYLLRTVEAQRLMDACDEQAAKVKDAPGSVFSADVKSAVEAEFGDAQGRRLTTVGRPAQRTTDHESATESANQQSEDSSAAEDRAGRVRTLFLRAHAPSPARS